MTNTIQQGMSEEWLTDTTVPIMPLSPPPYGLIAHVEPGETVTWKGYKATVEAVAGEYVRIAVPISKGRVTLHVIGKIELRSLGGRS